MLEAIPFASDRRVPEQLTKDEMWDVLPDDVVLGMRLSAVEFTDEGLQIEDTVEICRVLEQSEVQLLHISTGGNVSVTPETWPGYQLSYAQAVKAAVEVPVIGVGILQQPHLAEFALREDYCDLVLSVGALGGIACALVLLSIWHKTTAGKEPSSQNGEGIRFGIFLKDSDRLIGTCGFNSLLKRRGKYGEIG